jgi:hypothetical protein
MQSSWWAYRQWRFVADMNGDGSLTGSDLALWAEWLFYMPGDALIAQFGPTPIAASLALTPASFGSSTSAAISAVAWPLAIGVAFYLWGFLLDAGDPTYRQQKREKREAENKVKRAAKERARLMRRNQKAFGRPRREPVSGPVR